MCVVREGDTFYDLIKSGKIIEKDKNCPDSDKSCGIVDTFDRKLCVNKKDGNCLIHEDKIKNVNLNQLNYFLNEDSNKDKIISIIQLSDDYPCMNFTEKNWKT
jgi:hypothetical protein